MAVLLDLAGRSLLSSISLKALFEDALDQVKVTDRNGSLCHRSVRERDLGLYTQPTIAARLSRNVCLFEHYRVFLSYYREALHCLF